jgi:hypothetical protein
MGKLYVAAMILHLPPSESQREHNGKDNTDQTFTQEHQSPPSYPSSSSSSSSYDNKRSNFTGTAKSYAREKFQTWGYGKLANVSRLAGFGFRFPISGVFFSLFVFPGVDGLVLQ